MTIPYKGATTAQFYIAEVTPGVTPSNPAWLPLRTTSGVPAVTRDALVSNELNASREVTSIRTGNKQVSGEYAIELSSESQDDLLAGAMTSSWVAGSTVAGLSVTVDADAKTFTSASGDFTAAVSEGGLVYFPDLTGDNAKPFIATTVTALVITGAGIPHTLTDESTVTTDLVTADQLGTGALCKTFSILTWFKGACGGADAWVITRGVEFSGFSIEQAVNAMVTGSFPFLGRSQEVLLALPSGSTFPTSFDAEPFASVDVAAFDGSTALELIDTFTIANDNTASAQFALGSTDVAFVERGTAQNTFSLAGKLASLTLLEKFLNETMIEVTSILSGVNGAMSFTLKNAQLTAATPEIGGPESVTITLEGQATGSANESSILIQRLVY